MAPIWRAKGENDGRLGVPWPGRPANLAEGPARSKKTAKPIGFAGHLLIFTVGRLFQRRIRAKHVKANMHMAVMGKDPDLQVVRTIDVLADFQHQRHRIGRSQVGRNL
jgi:hypothetical protein